MTSATPYAEVIGDPIAHSKSPLIHNFWLKKLGMEGEYRATRVATPDLASYLESRGADPAWRGCNLTIPHKVAALAFVDEVDRSADIVGATNCIVMQEGKLVAFNTDTEGVDAAINVGHGSVCIIGAGGAARAAFPTLDVLRARDVRILARDPDKARRSLMPSIHNLSFFSLDEAAAAMRDVEGIINASPLGMAGQPAMPEGVLEAVGGAAPGAYVFDMVYAPLDTELLARARALQMQAIDGLVMLVGQAGGAFRRFFGRQAPRQHDAELRALLTA